MTKSVAGFAQTLLRAILQHISSLTHEQLSAAGASARRLLAFAWQDSPRSSWLVTNSLRAVCQTFKTDVAASAVLLRRAIQPEHLAKYGYEEMPVIAREASQIASVDPGLAADIYGAVFAYEEPSDDTTDISGSHILSLTSNKRQDYDRAKWQLAEFYPTFVRQHPLLATTAMINVIDAYRTREHASDMPPEAFEVSGVEVAIVHDYSHIWDPGAASQLDEEVMIVGAFFHQFERFAQDPGSDATVDMVLATLLHGARPAMIWSRLLQLAASYPKEIGLKIRFLASVPSLMWVPDTEDAAAAFIGAIFPLLQPEERREVENAILSLPDSVPEKVRKHAERDRDLLILSLENELTTDAAKDALNRLREANAKRQPLQQGPRFQVTSRPFDEETYLEELGVSTESEPNKKFLDLQRPVKDFYAKQTSRVPPTAEIEEILPRMQALRAELKKPHRDVDDKLLAVASGALAGACKSIAHTEGLSCETEVGKFVRTVLLEMSKHHCPEHNPDHDASFDKQQSWGGPHARIESAAGLTALARHASCVTPDLLDSIDRLSRDPAPEVRIQIADRLTWMHKTAPEKMWQLLEEWPTREASRAILGALGTAAHRLAGLDIERAAKTVKVIYGHILDGPGADEARDMCLTAFVGFYVWRDHQESRELLYTLSQDVRANHRAVGSILFLLRGTLAHEPKDATADGVRPRSIKLFHTITKAACDDFNAVLASLAESTTPKPDPKTVQSLARLVDRSARELYFASGVFTHQAPEEKISASQQKRFYEELAPTIDYLSSIGLPSAVHHLIEMLQAFIPFDPRRVFLQVASLVKSGKRGNYQYESMGADQIVGIIERYLAEYRSLLQDDAECRVALRKVLDAFVEAGWPAAQRMSYKLDEIFR